MSYRYTGSGLTGIDVEITDEENRKFRQEWVAFGDPNEPRLAAVTLDVGGSLQQLTNYSYNALGSLTGVSGTGSPTRSLTYTVRNELFTETHPESGLVTNTYDAAGNLATRQDANQAAVGASTKTFFRYDANKSADLHRPAAGVVAALRHFGALRRRHRLRSRGQPHVTGQHLPREQVARSTVPTGW